MFSDHYLDMSIIRDQYFDSRFSTVENENLPTSYKLSPTTVQIKPNLYLGTQVPWHPWLSAIFSNFMLLLITRSHNTEKKKLDM